MAASFDEIILNKPDIDEYPKTISTCWIPITEMQRIYEYNQNFINNINVLKNRDRIFAWKRSRGDGNCYFRAVISTFFLIINKPYLPDYYLKNFAEYVKTLNSEDLIYEYQEAQQYLIEILDDLIALRAYNPCEAFKAAYEHMQDEKFDLDLIRIARLSTYNEIIKQSESEEYSWMFIDGKDFILNDVTDMGKEGGELTLLFLPLSLQVQVIQYMYLDTPTINIQQFPEQVPEKSLQIRIVRRGAHYDILCSIQQMETEGLNLSEGKIKIIKNYQLAQSLFYNNCNYLG